MLMCVVRFGAPYDTEILITFNIPDKNTDEKEDKCSLGEGQTYR
jgi:hypothetical protein